MSGSLDKSARQLALKLLQKFGKIGSLSQENEGVYDPDTGQTTEVPPTLYPITFFIDSQKTGQLRANGLISNTDSIILVSALELGTIPKANDDITATSISTSIKSLEPVWSGEEVALYELVCVI